MKKLFSVFILYVLMIGLVGASEPVELSDEMFQALRHADTEKIGAILDAHPEQLEARNEYGETPLILATFYSSDAVCIKLLIERGADVNAADHFGVTPLMLIRESIDKAKLFIDAGADVNVYSNTDSTNFGMSVGLTPLSRIALYPNTNELLKLLIKNGANVNPEGFTPIQAAAKSGDVSTIHFLNDHGASHGGGRTLGYAIDNNHLDVVKLLVEKGYDLQNRSLIDIAAVRGYKEIVEYLLDQGVNVNKMGWTGTPLVIQLFQKNPTMN